VEVLRDVIVATGALEQVEQRIGAKTAAARDALTSPALSADCRAALDALAGAVTDRRA
jgi:geranylgeranyl diphosphate synthase type I